MRYLIFAFCVTLLIWPSLAFANEETARKMFVEAEMLRRADVCATGQQGAMEPIEQARIWELLEDVEKAEQLYPLWSALSGLNKINRAKREKLVRCLEKWKDAAQIEEKIMEQYRGTKAAFELAKKRRLTPSDVENIIELVKRTPHKEPNSGYSLGESILQDETSSSD